MAGTWAELGLTAARLQSPGREPQSPARSTGDGMSQKRGGGLVPQGNLGKLCLPKGGWGQPPKSVTQRRDIR